MLSQDEHPVFYILNQLTDYRRKKETYFVKQMNAPLFQWSGYVCEIFVHNLDDMHNPILCLWKLSPHLITVKTKYVLLHFRFGPYFCQPVIAGLGDEDKPFICTMDAIGAK